MPTSYMRAFAGKAKHAFTAGLAVGKRFLADNRAVSTVEYALIVVAVIAIIGVAAGTMSGAFTTLFDELEDEMTDGIDDVQNAVTPSAPATPSP